MPKSLKSKIRARGGAVKVRTKKIRGGYLRIIVTKRKGPRGGKTIAIAHTKTAKKRKR